MSMSNRPLIRTIALAAISLWATAARGETAEVTPSHPQRARARTFLVMRLAEELNLPDDKALQLSTIIRNSDEQRLKLQGQRHDLEAKLKATLDHPPPDTAALDKMIAQANEIDQQLALLPEQSFRESQKILTTEQQARLILLRPELQKQIQHAIRRRLGGDPEHSRFRDRLGRKEPPTSREETE